MNVKLIKAPPNDEDQAGEATVQPAPQGESPYPTNVAYPLASGADRKFWTDMFAAKMAEAKAIYRRFLGGDPRCPHCRKPY